MNRTRQIALASAITALVLVFLVLAGARSNDARRQKTCTGIAVEILDTARLGLVTPEEVKQALAREYGVFLGQRLDSVDLRRIEEILDVQSSVRKSEAYVTGDGLLHVSVTQREPAVKFVAADGSGFFADEGGFVFPLQSRVQVEVPQIEGRLPLSVGKGYKGRLTDEKERRWLLGVIQLVRYVQSSKVWNGRIEKIGVNDKGEITLKSTEGKERFLFGKPDGLAEKFARVETYYRTIAPSREPGWYSSVNVQYAGQIICRK